MPSTQTDRLSGLSTSVAVKAPCRVATTANITLSGEQTIDGVSVVADDRVLVKDQTTALENGIYVCKATSWERAKDFDGSRDAVTGTIVFIVSGTAGGGFFYKLTTTGTITIGTTSQTWASATFTDISVSSYWQGILALTSTAATLTALGVSTYVQTLLDDASAVNFRQTLGFPGNSTFADGIATVSTVGAYRNSSIATLSTAGILKGHGSLPNVTTSTAITLGASDAGTVIILAASATATLTAPSATSTYLSPGFQCAVFQRSTASILVAVQATDILLSKNFRNTITGQYSFATIFRPSSTAWALGGDISS